MIGIGPLVTIPLVIAALAGPLALVGWVAGASSRFATGSSGRSCRRVIPARAAPTSTCVTSSARNGPGRALAFLFNWQFLLQLRACLPVGTSALQTMRPIVYPALGSNVSLHDVVAIGIGVVTLLLLYRRTGARRVARRARARRCDDAHDRARRAAPGFRTLNFAQAFHLAARCAWARASSPASAARSTSRSTTTPATPMRRSSATRSFGRSARFRRRSSFRCSSWRRSTCCCRSACSARFRGGRCWTCTAQPTATAQYVGVVRRRTRRGDALPPLP